MGRWRQRQRRGERDGEIGEGGGLEMGGGTRENGEGEGLENRIEEG